MIVPLPAFYVPDGDEAQRWAEDELSNARYDEARPTWFDYLVEDIADFFNGLFSGDTGNAFGGLALVIIILVALAALVVALIVWGRPRATSRTARRSDLLGERDDRTAAQLRADAEKAAKSGDWDDAVVLRFRALARSLLERDVIDPAPGATAQAIAREAAASFPTDDDALRGAAGLFDDVRYLGHIASEQTYRDLVAIDDRLRAHSPVGAAAEGALA